MRRKGETEEENGTTDPRAVSEVVGVLLLLAVVVLGVGIVAVTVYSQPRPPETPQVGILVANTSDTVYLTHNGGDPLAKGTFYVLVDGVRHDGPVSPPGGAWPWTIGEVLQYGNVTPVPRQVQVVYTGEGEAVLLASSTLSGTVRAGGPDVPGGGGGSLHYDFDTPEERDAWVVEQFVEQLKGNSIYLGQNVQSQNEVWRSSGFFNFTLSDGDSYLELTVNNVNADPDRIVFAAGETMSIRLADSEMRFFAIGHGGWHIFATGVTVYRDGRRLDSGDKQYTCITGGRIYGFGDFDSSVTITTVASRGLQTELYVNNTPVITQVWNDPIVLAGVRPADPTLMILDISKNDPNYFIGSADSISI